MQIYRTARTTTASPQRVWELWSDTNNWTAWNSGIGACEIDGPLVSGATGMMQTVRGSKHDVVFKDVAPPNGFTMSMSGPPLTTISFVCEVTPNGSGSTIAQSAAFTGPLAFVFGPLLGKMMASHFVPVLDDLAAAAEKEPAPA
jgi:uncharacterized protein YndB with AHSA1/START domain